MRMNLEDYLDGLMTEIIKKRMNESPRPTRVIWASTPLGESVSRVFASGKPLDPHIMTWQPTLMPSFGCSD